MRARVKRRARRASRASSTSTTIARRGARASAVVTHSFIQSFIHSFAHSRIHPAILRLHTSPREPRVVAMPKMSVGRFLKNPVSAISNAFELNDHKNALRALEEQKSALERELEFAATLGDVQDRLDAMDVAARECYDLLTTVLGKLNNLPRDDESSADMREEDERFCELLKEACAATVTNYAARPEDEEERETIDANERETIDEDERDSRICALLENYRDCAYRRAEAHALDAAPFRHRLYRCVDKQLTELNKFRDELRKQTQIQSINIEELKGVNQQIEATEKKLSAVRQKQFG